MFSRKAGEGQVKLGVGAFESGTLDEPALLDLEAGVIPRCATIGSKYHGPNYLLARLWIQPKFPKGNVLSKAVGELRFAT